jgi:hypothetical protein
MKFEHQKLNQCMFFKENILQKIINEYNNHYKKYKDETYILQDSYLLLNNNNKYYCLITSKKVFYNNNQKDNNQSILYFFNNYDSNDFYIEIDFNITYTLLLEGYMYNNNLNYYTTDLLYNNYIVKDTFIKRYEKLKEITTHLKIKTKEYIQLDLQEVILKENIQYLNLYKNKFKYKNELTHIEIINGDYNKHNIKLDKNDTIEKCSGVKKIVKDKNLVEIYKVYSTETNEFEGILLVQSLKESKLLNKMFLHNSNEIKYECLYNKTFNKFQIKIT